MMPIEPESDMHRYDECRWETLLLEAERGVAAAQYALAMRYFEGHGGVEADESSAEYWLQKSADSGFAPAEFAMANVLNNAGKLNDALTYYIRAGEQGFRDAITALRVIWKEEGAEVRTIIGRTASGNLQRDIRMVNMVRRGARDQAGSPARSLLPGIFSLGIGILLGGIAYYVRGKIHPHTLLLTLAGGCFVLYGVIFAKRR